MLQPDKNFGTVCAIARHLVASLFTHKPRQARVRARFYRLSEMLERRSRAGRL